MSATDGRIRRGTEQQERKPSFHKRGGRGYDRRGKRDSEENRRTAGECRWSARQCLLATRMSYRWIRDSALFSRTGKCMRENCWDFRNCTKTDCPVRTEDRLDGVHGGSNAGRACWAVPSTHCMGVQGSCLDKKPHCSVCAFYQKVRREEGARIKSNDEILAALDEDDPPGK